MNPNEEKIVALRKKFREQFGYKIYPDEERTVILKDTTLQMLEDFWLLEMGYLQK